MGREYSNRRPAKARSSAPHQLLVITITFLLGYLTATVFDLETVTRWVNAQVLAHNDVNKEAAKPHAQQQAAIPPKPKFEFYTLLTNEKASNSQAVAKPTAATTAGAATVQTAAVNTATAVKAITPNTTQQVAVKTVEAKPAAPVGKGAYSIQVASFKARQDAEHMKGSLTLKGFSVAIVPINHAIRGNWFRVVVGPYSDRALAQKALTDLSKNEHLHGMLTTG